MILIILGIILVLVMAITSDEVSTVFLTILGVVFIILGLYLETKDKYPKAIDVYRNKTTLRITYQDSIPLDTVVVFKPEIRSQ